MHTRPITRRLVLGLIPAVPAVLLLSRQVAAQDAGALALGREVAGLVTGGLRGGGIPAAAEAIFARHADMTVIAQSVLGPLAAGAEAGQMRAFATACRAEMIRETARRLQDYAGGEVQVRDVRAMRNFHEVSGRITGPNRQDDLRLHVSDRSGAMRFFNLLVGGNNMLAQGRTRVEALVARHGGDLEAVTRALSAG